MNIRLRVVVSNCLLALFILGILWFGFLTGVSWCVVHYVNHLLSEPVRFASMFVAPFYFVLGVFWFVRSLRVAVEYHKKTLKRLGL